MCSVHEDCFGAPPELWIILHKLNWFSALSRVLGTVNVDLQDIINFEHCFVPPEKLYFGPKTYIYLEVNI